jgi:hypothetical protein
MRASTARLMNSPIRLTDLAFPQVSRLIQRTRLAFIHLDNVLAFAKRDRDGRVDGYLTAYLPEECVFVFLRKGEAVNAATIRTTGREVITINEGLRRMRSEVERGELTYCTAPLEQLAWMYRSCVSEPEPRFIDAAQPEALFPSLQQERVTGVLELITNGHVSYLRIEDGRFIRGYFFDKPPDQPVPRYVEGLFRRGPDGELPSMSASLFPAMDDLPAQASAALVATYRELYWRVVDGVEREFPGDGRRRAETAKAGLEAAHPALRLLSLARAADIPDAVVQPDDLVAALSEWVRVYLEPVEVMMPGTALKVIQVATWEHRYVLQAAGFYRRVPWPVKW